MDVSMNIILKLFIEKYMTVAFLYDIDTFDERKNFKEKYVTVHTNL